MCICTNYNTTIVFLLVFLIILQNTVLLFIISPLLQYYAIDIIGKTIRKFNSARAVLLDLLFALRSPNIIIIKICSI